MYFDSEIERKYKLNGSKEIKSKRNEKLLIFDTSSKPHVNTGEEEAKKKKETH